MGLQDAGEACCDALWDIEQWTWGSYAMLICVHTCGPLPGSRTASARAACIHAAWSQPRCPTGAISLAALQGSLPGLIWGSQPGPLHAVWLAACTIQPTPVGHQAHQGAARLLSDTHVLGWPSCEGSRAACSAHPAPDAPSSPWDACHGRHPRHAP